MAVTFNPYEAQTLESMGDEITDSRFVSNEGVEEMLEALKKLHLENEKFFDDCIDDRQYWTMGDPMNTTWVLNRSLIDEPRRVPPLEWLDRKKITEGEEEDE